MRSAPAGRTRALLLALAVLAASAAALAIAGEPEWPLFALCAAGVLAGLALGVPPRELAVLAAGLAVICWAIVLVPSPHPRLMGVVAHFSGGALLAWALAGPARARWPWARGPRWSAGWLLLALLVLAVGAIWELGELVADELFDVDLSVDALDVALDLGADLAGALAGLTMSDRRGPAGGSPR